MRNTALYPSSSVLRILRYGDDENITAQSKDDSVAIALRCADVRLPQPRACRTRPVLHLLADRCGRVRDCAGVSFGTGHTSLAAIPWPLSCYLLPSGDSRWLSFYW